MQWLLGLQDRAGGFPRYTYEDLASTYSACLACRLAKWGDHAADRADWGSPSAHRLDPRALQVQGLDGSRRLRLARARDIGDLTVVIEME